MHYVALIHKQSGSAYGVTVPDCPGCTAAAESLDAAVQAAAEALRLWAQAEESAGRAVPPARALEEVRADADVRSDIKDGAIAILVPLLADAGRTERINITLDAGLLHAIDAAADARGLTRSAFLASAARDKITGAQ